MKLELFDIEDRGVAVAIEGDKGTAWAWDSGAWRDAPGLVGKAYLRGKQLTRPEFVDAFPTADLNLLPLPEGRAL